MKSAHFSRRNGLPAIWDGIEFGDAVASGRFGRFGVYGAGFFTLTAERA
jgi:hypothetical protein